MNGNYLGVTGRTSSPNGFLEEERLTSYEIPSRILIIEVGSQLLTSIISIVDNF